MMRFYKDFKFQNFRIDFNLDMFLMENLKVVKRKAYDLISRVNLINR